MNAELYSIISNFENNKKMIKKLEKENEIFKQTLKNHMKKENLHSFNLQDKAITRRIMYKSFISKGNVPNDIWERYATITEYETLNITKKIVK